MALPTCQHCGHQATSEATTCPSCGQALKNGTVQRVKSPVQKPPPPAEVAGWVIEKVPPEMIEEAIRTFDEEEWRTALREVEETGGVKFEDFIGEIEEIVIRSLISETH